LAAPAERNVVACRFRAWRRVARELREWLSRLGGAGGRGSRSSAGRSWCRPTPSRKGWRYMSGAVCAIGGGGRSTSRRRRCWRSSS